MRFVRRLLRTTGVGARAAIASIAGYLTILTVAAWTARRDGESPGRTGEATRRFRVLIPAHDEERLIGATLASLTAQRYPRDRYEVHVVADNCTDDNRRRRAPPRCRGARDVRSRRGRQGHRA